MNLLLDQHRINDHAAIMYDHVFFDLDPSKLRVDLDDRRMRGIGPGHRGRFEISRFFKAGGDPLRPLVIPTRTSRLGYPGKRQLPSRNTDQSNRTVAQFEIDGRALEYVGSNRKNFFLEDLA